MNPFVTSACCSVLLPTMLILMLVVAAANAVAAAVTSLQGELLLQRLVNTGSRFSISGI